MASVRSATPTKAARVTAPAPVKPVAPVVSAVRVDGVPQLNTGGAGTIPPATRARLEASFGADLSGVRVSTGPGAAGAARAVQARAFAFGPHVVLGSGLRADELPVMAHEVAHVLQQQAVPVPGRGSVLRGARDARGTAGLPAVRLGPQGFAPPHALALGPGVLQRWTPAGGDRFEAEANRAVSAVALGQPFRVTERTGGAQVQKLGLSDILDWFADKANIIPGFRMFTIIIGVNPINMSSVDRSPGNILRAVIEFVPGGGLITQALDNYGIFDKAGNWIAEQIATLGMVGGAFRDALMGFLDSLGWRDLFHPGDVWDRAKRIFTDPIDRVFDFLKGLAVGFVTLIKDAILRPLAKLAEGTRAWDLLIAVLGENPITGDKVPRTAETLIPGFLKLIGQEEVWENMKKANALGRAWAWFQSALSGLIGFVSQIPTLAINAFKSLELADIILLPRAFLKVGAVFGGFVADFVGWAGRALWNLLEIVFDVVSPGAFGYVKKTGAALKSILKNPLPFVGNLARAALAGFNNFKAKFGAYLKAGLIDWLTGSLTGVYIPQSFAFAELVKFVLSVLGLTWENVRGKLVKAVGETAVKAMEAGFQLVVTLVREGPAAAWKELKEQLTTLEKTILGGIVDMVVDAIVQKAIPKLVAMFIPGAGFISAILSIYDMVMVVVRQLARLAALVKGFVDSIVAIAAGNIGAAAAKVESILANLLTLAINFLAGFAGLGKIANKVKGIIDKIRAPVDKALDFLINLIVTGARKLGKFVAQAGVPNDPNERLKLASRAAVAVARGLRGRVTGPLLAGALTAIRVRYGLTDIQPYERDRTWWVRARINPGAEVSTGVPSVLVGPDGRTPAGQYQRAGGGPRTPEGPNYQPLIAKLTQAVQMFTVWARRGTSPVAQSMLRGLERAREQAQLLHEDQGRGVPLGTLRPRMQALGANLQAIQALDPDYELVSIGALAVTVNTARRQMPRTQVRVWTMIDPNWRPEYERQLRDQEAGLNSMTADLWQQNRSRFSTSGRPAAERALRRRYGARMGRPPGAAAPHNPDQSLSGFIDPTGLPANSAVNSHIGSQNGRAIPLIEAAINRIHPPARVVTQLNFELGVV